MNPWQIVQALEADNSRLHKQRIISENIDNDEFVRGVQLLFSQLDTFGIKKIPVAESDGPGLPFPAFEESCKLLIDRKVTGNAAQDLVRKLCDCATINEWNLWYRRILLKKFDCGVNASTLNKVRKGTIPLFQCMLAKDASKNLEKMLKGLGECLIEWKYDGVRVVAIIRNGVCELYSRSGKRLVNFPHVEEVLSHTQFEGLVFDGEIMSEDFQTLMMQVNRKSDVKTDDAYFVAFDVLPFKEFQAGKSRLNTFQRKMALTLMLDNFHPAIRAVESWVVDMSTDRGREEFARLNDEALAAGLEGSMIKPANALYECKRSSAWLKYKPNIEVSLSIAGCEEGTGKYEGMLGALICKGWDDDKYYEVRVGSGLSDADRESMWANRDKLPGVIVEIRADAATMSQSGEHWSLRFPRFLRFRGFELGEKL